MLSILPVTCQGAEPLVVEVIGVEGAIFDNIMAHLSIVRQKKSNTLTSSIIKRFHAKAEEEIARAVSPFGYYRPEIKATLHHDIEADKWRAEYKVNLGPPLMVTEVTIDIAGDALADPVFMDFVKGLPLKKGTILNQVSYEKAKRQLTILSEDRGYFDAALTHSRITIDEQAYQAKIHLAMDTGSRYCLLPVIFHQSDFKDTFLENFVTFQPGDPYSIDTLLKFRTALENSDYFSQVTINQKKIKEIAGVRLEVDLEPKQRDRYTLRTGYGTDSELRLGADWQRHYLNRSGHRVSGKLSAAQYKKKVAAKFAYIIPSGPINENYWEISLNHKGEDYPYEDLGDLSENNDAPGGVTRDNTFSFRISHDHSQSIFGNIFKDWKITETISLEYMWEYYNLLELLAVPEDLEFYREILLPDELKILEPDFRAWIPSISWKITQVDNRSYAQRGWQVGLTLKGANESLGSNFSFLQASMMSKLVYSLGKSGRFIGRFDAAYTDCEMVDLLYIYDEAILPKALQFSTGGDRSVRGYAYEELNGMDTLVEGRHFLNVSAEYEHRIKDAWSMAVFTDIGNAFNHYSRMKLQYGAGFGVRWLTPIGLLGQIRLDVAWALSKDNKPARIHLVVGPDF